MNAPPVLLIVSLPPHPSSLLVRAWRRLRGLGAVALKRTVYLLPDTPDHYEHFQWLSQEIQREGARPRCSASTRSRTCRPPTIRVFHEARDPEYRALDLAIRGLLGAHPDDQDVLTHGLALFEGLYAGASCKG